jgi:hypothetical protein
MSEADKLAEELDRRVEKQIWKAEANFDENLKAVLEECRTALRSHAAGTTRQAASKLTLMKAAGDEMAEALREMRDSCTRTPVGGGDGETYIVEAPTGEALKAAQAALTQWQKLSTGEGE